MRISVRGAVVAGLTASAVATSACSGAPKGDPGDLGGAQYAPLESRPSTTAAEAALARSQHANKTVFVIVMENHDWRDIEGSPSAPFINGTLLREGAHAENYVSPRGIHPSEPNYIWLEAGSNLAILDDDEPRLNHRTTTAHLTRQLASASIPWTSYQEGIRGDRCPVTAEGRYAPKHNPMVYFDDITTDPEYCRAHVRPYAELAGDLADNRDVAAYNFITPDLCNDMHDTAGCASGDSVHNGDAWLSREVPMILASEAYRDGGVLFITWDESESGPGVPIGLIALSPNVKPGYANQTPYTHSSLLRTVQDLFGLRPYLRDAENATALDDLFTAYP
jgi:hypothetical protein